MGERRVRRYANGALFWESAPVADECRVDILVGGRRRASVMASPSQLDALAVGFLFGGGFIAGRDDIKSLSVEGLEISVELREGAAAAPWPRLSHPPLEAARILALSEAFNAHSRLFRQTGAVHSCRLLDGPACHHADDIARHNALDKVIGRYLLAGPSGAPGLILTTGRISTELLLKAARAGIGSVISRSAPTDRAVELAGGLNMILIGFARQNRFNIYQGADRIEPHCTAAGERLP